MHQITSLLKKHYCDNVDQIFVLEKALAKAVAYKVPCYYGKGHEAERFYNDGVRKLVHKLLGKVNEHRPFNINSVIVDVHDLWIGRFYIANDAMRYNQELTKFDEGCKVPGTNHKELIDKLTPLFAEVMELEITGASVC